MGGSDPQPASNGFSDLLGGGIGSSAAP